MYISEYHLRTNKFFEIYVKRDPGLYQICRLGVYLVGHGFIIQEHILDLDNLHECYNNLGLEMHNKIYDMHFTYLAPTYNGTNESYIKTIAVPFSENYILSLYLKISGDAYNMDNIIKMYPEEFTLY
jgi:hypothetical protein